MVVLNKPRFCYRLALRTVMSVDGKTPLGYKVIDRLQKSIGIFKDQDGEDSLRLFDSWWTNSFMFYVNLAKNDHVIVDDLEAQRNLFTKCLEEDIRLRLENSVLLRQMKDLTPDELVEQTKSLFRNLSRKE